jgi:hypothetical protein
MHGAVQSKKDQAVKYPTKDAVFILTSNWRAHAIKELLRTDPNAAYARFHDEYFANLSLPDNPFGKEETLRRLKAGHALAGLDSFGFVLFDEPSREQRFALVQKVLEGMDGLVWTPRALEWMQRRAEAKSRGQGLALTESAVFGAVASAIEVQNFTCSLNKARVVLYAPRDELLAKVLCEGQAKEPSSLAEPSPPSSYTRSSSSAGESCVDSREQSKDAVSHEEIDVQPEPLVNVQPEPLVIVQSHWDLWIEWLRTWCTALVIVYALVYWLFPLLQILGLASFMFVLGVVLAVIWAICPYIRPFVMALWEIFKFLGSLVINQPGLAAIVLVFLLLQTWWWRRVKRHH